MKQKSILRMVFITMVLSTFVFVSHSCKDDSDDVIDLGTVTGLISDELGMPLEGASVSISGNDASVTTGADGIYLFSAVSLEQHVLKVEKEGYLTTSVTVTSSRFNEENEATLNISLVEAPAKIIGTILDARNDNSPLSGVFVSVSASDTAYSDADGKFEIKNLPISAYTVTFTKDDYSVLTRNVSQDDFVDNVVTLDVKMGGDEVLPGLIVEDLADASKWYYNEYRGGRNSDAYPHWDWSTDYLCVLDFMGAWEEQNEGTTLQIQNNDNDQSNPADLDNFDSFIYGSKEITEDNKILSLRYRTHDADADAPAYFGVQVVDLSAATPTATKIGNTETYGSSDYSDSEFDLSAYVGKEIIIAIGIYRKETGDYWKQFVIRSIRFASSKVVGTSWLPGTEVLTNWHLTKEMVRSTMVQPKSSFTGISPISGDRDFYFDAYRSWRDVNFIMKDWCFMPINKDPELFSSEGMIIKTRGDAPVDTDVPESYLYSKIAIASGNDQLTLKIRSFGDHSVFFKITAVKEDGTVTYMTPISHTALDASASDNGCWRLIHEAGDAGDPDAYASFVYDFSEFDGSNVVVAFSVHKGESTNTDENKLGIYSIEFN